MSTPRFAGNRWRRQGAAAHPFQSAMADSSSSCDGRVPDDEARRRRPRPQRVGRRGRRLDHRRVRGEPEVVVGRERDDSPAIGGRRAAERPLGTERVERPVLSPPTVSPHAPEFVLDPRRPDHAVTLSRSRVRRRVVPGHRTTQGWRDARPAPRLDRRRGRGTARPAVPRSAVRGPGGAPRALRSARGRGGDAALGEDRRLPRRLCLLSAVGEVEHRPEARRADGSRRHRRRREERKVSRRHPLLHGRGVARAERPAGGRGRRRGRGGS